MLAAVAFCGSGLATAGVVDIHPGADIPSVVSASPAGTTFNIFAGTYRLEGPIEAKTGDVFTGQKVCAPPSTPCPVIISGSRIIGPSATFDGKNYKVTGQTQQGATDGVIASKCQPSWTACMYPEDLFFDEVPLQRLSATSLPTIASGQWWFDYANDTIYFHDNPAGHVVETSVVPNAFAGDGNNVIIKELTIKEFASPAGTPGTIGMPGNSSLTQGINWTIKNCEILLNHGMGIRVALGMQILNNYIHNNGQLGIGGGLATNSTTRSTPSGIVIAGNVITYNNYAHFLPQFGSGGIKICATKGVVIRSNTITNNDGAGIHFDMSDESPLIDGNTVTDNTGGGGVEYEVSLSSATVRNNISVRNGAELPTESGSNANVASYASTGVEAYCNVLGMPNVAHAQGFLLIGSNRGYNPYPPGQYLTATGNTFHHNTIIWDPSATAIVGYQQADAANQPNFFADNTPPDFNMYHIPNLSTANFIYDNNNSQKNSRKTFAQYQAAGADVHGTVDTKYANGYPTVTITSPADEASIGNSVTIAASASDPSGIEKVEFYVDWSLRTTVTSGPYSFDWTNAAQGSHTVAAMAYSKAGIGACFAVTLNKQ
jgi:parallel beta-helix repeat protein